MTGPQVVVTTDRIDVSIDPSGAVEIASAATPAVVVGTGGLRGEPGPQGNPGSASAVTPHTMPTIEDFFGAPATADVEGNFGLVDDFAGGVFYQFSVISGGIGSLISGLASKADQSALDTLGDTVNATDAALDAERMARLKQAVGLALAPWAIVGGFFDGRGLYRMPYADVGPNNGNGFDLRIQLGFITSPMMALGEFWTQSHDNEVGSWDNFEGWYRPEANGWRIEFEWTEQVHPDDHEVMTITAGRSFAYGEVPPQLRITIDFVTGEAQIWWETFDPTAADFTSVDGSMWERDGTGHFTIDGGTSMDTTCTADWLVGSGNGTGDRRAVGKAEMRFGIDTDIVLGFDPSKASADFLTIPDTHSGGTWTALSDVKVVGADPRSLSLLGSGGGITQQDLDDAIEAHATDTDPHGDRAYTDTAIASLIGAAPGTLDTLAELAAALQADEAGAAALATTVAGKQPLDSDLTAIAALTTTTFGRAFLALADQAAAITHLGLGSAALLASTAFDAAGSASTAQAAAIAASQPVDADLTAIAALTTTSFGRSFLALADAAAARTLLGLGSAALSASTAFAASGDYRPTWQTGNYYGHEGLAVSNSANNMVTGQVKAMPFWNATAHTIDRITIDIFTGVASTTGYVYLCSDSNGYPGAVIASGSITAATSSTYAEATITATAPRGLLWLVCHGTSVATWGPRAVTGQNPLLPTNTSSSANVPNCYNATGAGTTLLTSFPAGAALASTGVRMLVRST